MTSTRDIVRSVAALAAVFFLAAGSGLAQGVHPAYLHALTDLRTARAHLDYPDAGPLRDREIRAIREVDAAIDEIKRAAADDGKNLADHPPVDARLDAPGRLHQALELLNKVRNDVAGREDNPAAKEPQQRALGHVEMARHEVEEAIQVNGPPAAPGLHPAYLHALSDLRHARAHLFFADRGELREQERKAVEEIDRAIDEIKKAALDDGKNLDDHPPIDTHLDWPGRLHQARELLGKAHSDVAGDEDDRFAQGLQHRALEHIDAARRHVDEAIQAVAAPR